MFINGEKNHDHDCFFSICTWFYVIISGNFWKNKIKKIMYNVWKKTHIPIVKIMYHFWRIGADLFNQKIPHFSPTKVWIFRGGFFTWEGWLFIAPAWTFPDVLLYSAPLLNLHRTSEVDDYRTAQALDPVEFLGEWLAPSTPPKRKKKL